MKKLIEFLILGYKRYISPLKGQTCRYYPTCSQYALTSLEKYGLLRGTLKTLWRVLRCNPLSKGGYDPA